MLCRHLVKHWARTQASVALSSGEAELTSLVKGSCEALGVRDMLKEMGHRSQCVVETDSSAARGTVHRSGKGRLKHLQASSLWVQEHAAAGSIKYKKISRSANGADLLTHHCAAAELHKHLQNLGVAVASGQ